MPAVDLPSGVSDCSQMLTGEPVALPSFFQTRASWPGAGTTTVGSMSPPKAAWQTNGAEEVSVNGPVGPVENATPRHSRLVAASSVLSSRTHPPATCCAVGPHVMVDTPAGADQEAGGRTTSAHVGRVGRESATRRQWIRSVDAAVGTLAAQSVVKSRT